jgi:hypothetical protein
MTHYHDATASSVVTKVWGEVFAPVHAVTAKHHSSLACYDKFFENDPLDATQNDEHAQLCLSPVSPLSALVLCLRVITVTPPFSTYDNDEQECCIIRSSLQTLTCIQKIASG